MIETGGFDRPDVATYKHYSSRSTSSITHAATHLTRNLALALSVFQNLQSSVRGPSSWEDVRHSYGYPRPTTPGNVYFAYPYDI